MKHSVKRVFRSCVSLLLVLCMVCSLPLTALAADSTAYPKTSGVADVNGDGIITYVSFGDSVTNGYGMEGYRFEDGTNVYGFRRAPAASYPALIRDQLQNAGYTVNLEQMAISGFRMDELHWMLCDDYVADSYHNDFFATWNRNVVDKLRAKDTAFAAAYPNYDGTVGSANTIIMSEYRNAVKKADLITIDLGTNNFGTFVTNTIQEILGLKKLNYTVDFTQYVDANTAASLEGILGQMIGNMVNATSGPTYDLAMTLARCLMYGYLGFTEHYDGAIEAIYELNPNAKVVVIDCYTMITGVDLAGEALGDNIDLDQLYDMFIDLSNFYTRELSPYANKVTHASMEGAPELFIDYYKDYPDADYPDNQYMHPSAERLMNEFIMENMGYDPDDPEQRANFEADILSSIQLLDGYVNNLTATIQAEVIDKNITPVLNETVGDVEAQVNTSITAIDLIYTAVAGVAAAEAQLPTAQAGVAAAREAVAAAKAGVATAQDAVDTAKAGVATAQDAVDTAKAGVATAKDAVDTAIGGVATASSLVDMVVEQFLGHSLIKMFFKGSQTSSSLYDTIIDNTVDVLKENVNLSDYGLENTDENYKMVAAEVYDVAVIYYDEINYNGGNEASATKLAIIEVMRFFLLKTKGYSEDDAATTAALAWELNSICEAQGEPAAIKAAIETEITDALMTTLGAETKAEAAEMVYFLGISENDTAVKEALKTQMTSELMDTLGVSSEEEAAEMVHFLGTSDKETAVKAALKTQMTEEKLAELGLTGMSADEAAALVYDLGTKDAKPATIQAMTLKVDLSTAELAYAMVEAYEAVINNGGTEADAEAAAVKTAVAASLTEENMAALAVFGIADRTVAAGMVYDVAKLYNANNTDPESDKTAVVACLVALAAKLGIKGIDETTAATGYDLYAGVYKPALDAGKSEDEAKGLAVVAAIKTQYPAEGLAEAIYAVYKGKATKEQQYLAYYSLMVGVAEIPENIAEAVCTCYTQELDGQFDNEYVQTTMLFFMSQLKNADGTPAIADPAGDYASYLQYKNLPKTLHKIAMVDTIYFDALLTAAGNGLDLSAVAKKFMAGTLVLDKPGADATEADWAQYKADSALATLFFRFMSQDGIYTHPSEEGQYALYQAASAVLDKLLTPEADREVQIQEDSNVLILGDFIAANTGSYADALGGKVTNLSDPNFRINDVRALLDSGYGRDEYSQTFLSTVNTDYAQAVKDSNVIVVNLGSMNMGMIAKQLELYMSTGDTYSMEFSDLDNMKIQSLGMTMDGFLNNFSGAFGTDATGALMLAFETYGYGYTTFADCLDNTIETIQKLNPQADILLVGMYDLLGDAYISGSGMYLEMGHFVGHAVDLMNRHMENYAAMTDNVTYVDVTDVQTLVRGKVNMMDGGVTGIADAFQYAIPTEAGYASMAAKINCAMGNHSTTDEITWQWNADFSAFVTYTCSACGASVTAAAQVESDTTATCTEAGTATHTATVYVNSESITDTKEVFAPATGHAYEHVVTAPTCYAEGFTTHTCGNCGNSYTDTTVAKLNHAYGEPVWSWTETFEASAAFSCSNTGCEEVVTEAATVTNKIDDPTCENAGLITYNATLTFNNKTYTDSKTDPIAALGHDYKAEVTAPSCTEGGFTTYTCGNCDDSYISDETPAAGHDYGEDGKCHCGETDPNAHPSCEYTKTETLTSGKTYMLKLGGTDVGSYTFTEVSGGWAIQAENGTYLALADKALTYTAEPFAWTYSNGTFSTTVTTTSSSGNNWWNNIFGGWWGSGSGSSSTTTTTYYLAASSSSVTVSTSADAAQATFYTAHSEAGHNFGSGVATKPTCTQQGYTTYTCDRCGYSYTGNYITATGHSYTAKTTNPTCTEQGYTVYTCGACGDSYTDNYTNATGHSYTETVIDPTCTEQGYTKHTCGNCGDSYMDSYVDAAGHTMVDGVCTTCGYVEGSEKPPVEPEHPECQYTKAETLTSGKTYMLKLGGTDVGTYTFTEVSGGWAIQTADGSYLALAEETLAYTADPFAWTYADGTFSTVVTKTNSSGNNWWNNIFGGWWGSGSGSSSTTTTYYLAASGNSVTVSTSADAAQAAFYTTHSSATHSFDSGVVTKPTCTTGGCTTYTCVNCGYSYTGSLTNATGHSYSASVTAPTCTEQGYILHVCTACGDSYTDNYTNATGHTMVDGTCTSCGHTEGTEPPVEPESDCSYLAEKSLTSGNTYVLKLGGKNVGTYTFSEISGGWAIQAENGSYLALSGSSLTNASEPFAWTYSNGTFSTTVKTSSSSGSWWENLFGGNWGSGSSKSTTYYLVASGNSVGVSTSSSGAAAEFYQNVTGTHVYGDPVAGNGQHVYACINCGNTKSESCSDENCVLCHPQAPEAVIHVDVQVTSKSTGSSWGDWFGNWWGSGSRKTTYTATITVSAENTAVESVAYSTNGGSSWTNGTSFTSSSNITAFDIRVAASNGQNYYFTYNNGTVTEVA